MTDAKPSRRSSSSRGRWTLICLLLAPAVIVPLAVPFYAKVEPALFGFPFYFWFQLALIPASVALTALAYYLAKGADERDREAHGIRRREVSR